MPAKAKIKNVNSQLIWSLVLAILLTGALSIALVIALIGQAKIISQYDLLSNLDNQACRYLAERGADAQVNGGFRLASNANKEQAKLTYYCFTGESTKSKIVHGKQIEKYPFGATVMYFSNNEAAEKYANEKLNPLRYWGEDGSNEVQDKNYTFLVTDEKEPYFDAYRVRANAVLRVSLPCKSKSYEACDAQAKQLLDQELKGINVEDF